MARINIEDSATQSLEFIDLCLMYSKEYSLPSKVAAQTAVGSLYYAWKLAQRFWKKNEGLIPFEEWDEIPNNKFLVDARFAKKLEFGIYMKGSKDQFNWLLTRSEAGQKGGNAKAQNRIDASNFVVEKSVIQSDTVSELSTESKQTLANVSKRKPPTPTPTPPQTLFNKYNTKRESNKNGNADKSAGLSSSNFKNKILEIWDAERKDLAKVVRFTEKRQKAAAARWAENPSEESWIQIVRKLASNSFCAGRNDRGWKADFDYLLKPDTWVKVLEGKYDNAGYREPEYSERMKMKAEYERERESKSQRQTNFEESQRSHEQAMQANKQSARMAARQLGEAAPWIFDEKTKTPGHTSVLVDSGTAISFLTGKLGL